MVRDLLAARADVNSRSMKEKIGVPKGHMALMSAAISGHAEVCTELISAQASVATQNGLGMSALHCSVQSSRSAPVVEALTQAGCPLEARAVFPLGGTPLIAAAFWNNPEAVVALLEAKADPRATARSILSGFRRSTALDFAVRYGRAEAASVLADATEA